VGAAQKTKSFTITGEGGKKNKRRDGKSHSKRKARVTGKRGVAKECERKLPNKKSSKRKRGKKGSRTVPNQRTWEKRQGGGEGLSKTRSAGGKKAERETSHKNKKKQKKTKSPHRKRGAKSSQEKGKGT